MQSATRRCVCSCTRQWQQARYASTSSAASPAEPSKTKGFWSRKWQQIQDAVNQPQQTSAKVTREQQKAEAARGEGSLFARAQAEASKTISPKKVWTEHKTSTGAIPISPRKLNEVARLVVGLPIDSAILQAQLSDKRVAKSRVKSMLVLARDHAVMKGLDRKKLVVREAWVSKGIFLKRLDIKGRGRHGIIMKPEARMHVILAPGPSRAEMQQKKFDKMLKQKLRSGAGYVRADKPIMNHGMLKGAGAAYAW